VRAEKAGLTTTTDAPATRPGRFLILRDLGIFGLKVLLDGLKDVVLIQVAAVAAGLDVLFPGKKHGHRFYAVLRVAERFDQWLNLYGAIERATAANQGLFEASMAGADNLLGKLEAIVTGRDERPESERARRGGDERATRAERHATPREQSDDGMGKQ
jgi:hypothetical protein